MLFYCPQSETKLKAILEHSVLKHPEEVLKYTKLILCETSGKHGYMEITYEHIPLNVFQRGETLDITEEGVFVHPNKLTTSPAFDSLDNNRLDRQAHRNQV